VVCLVFIFSEEFSVFLLVYSRVLNTADGDLLVDYSKNTINDEVMKLLVDLVFVPSSQLSAPGLQFTTLCPYKK